MERRRVFPFVEGETIHVLSTEDLVIFKAIFDRDKDWRDIAELAYALDRDLDREWIQDWLDLILGRSDTRFERCAEALETPG